MKPIQIMKVKDTGEKHYTDKGLLFNIPFKLLIVGRSHLSGKSNMILNLLLQDDPRLYKNDFKGENIYLFSPSIKTDTKMKMLIEEKDIPESNLFESMDENIIEALYENIQEEYLEAIQENEKPPNVLFIFDDMSFGGSTKNSAIEKLFCNGRHLNISTMISSQKYAQMLSTTCRENATGMILFKSTDKQLEAMSDDNNYFEDRKDFKKLFKKLTTERHSFLVVNYTNGFDNMYMNKNFEPVGKCGKVKGKGCQCD